MKFISSFTGIITVDMENTFCHVALLLGYANVFYEEKLVLKKNCKVYATISDLVQLRTKRKAFNTIVSYNHVVYASKKDQNQLNSSLSQRDDCTSTRI